MKKNRLHKFFGIVMAAVMLLCFAACNRTPEGGGTVLPPDTDEEPYVTELVITTPPTKIKYKPGEDFDSTGMTLTAIWSHLDDDGNHIEEELSPDECENSLTGPIDSSVTQITFTYEGKSAVLDLILDSAALVKVVFDDSSLSKTLLPGTVNLYAGIKATAHYDDNSTLELSAFDIYEVTGTTETKIENPEAYKISAGTHTFVAKYDKYSSDKIVVSVISGYTVESTNIAYSEFLDKNRDIYIGTNFLENPSPAVYEDADCTKQLISGNPASGYLSDGTAVTFPNIKGGKYYRVGEENGVPCLQDVRKGHVMRFHIYSEADATVELILNAASAYMLEGSGWSPTVMGDMQFNRVFDINIVKTNPQTGEAIQDEEGNDIKEQLTIADEVILPGKTSESPDMALWANFVDVSFGELKLQKGDNIIELIVTSNYSGVVGACAANIGSFKVLTLPETCEHDLQKVNGTPATCSEYGKVDYWRCVNCSRTFADENGEERIYNAPLKLPMTNHTPGEDANCLHNQICTVCKVELAPKTDNHVPGEAANCLHNQVCTVCNKELAPITNNHNFGAELACGQSAECTVCHKTVENPHTGVTWTGDEAKCGKCHATVGHRYTVQAEDTQNVTFANTGNGYAYTTEDTTATNNWADPVSNGSVGSSLGEITGQKGWVKNSTTMTVKINVGVAGRYKLKMRAQSNTLDGGKTAQDLSKIFECKVNDGEYVKATGVAQPSSDVGNWHRAYNWGIVTFAIADLQAGENTITLKYIGDRGPNIDYIFAESDIEATEPEVQTVLTRGEASYTVGATTKHGVLENVMIRIKLSAAESAELGCDYRDICVTDAIISAGGGTFDTSTAGEHTLNLKVNYNGKEYTTTYTYTVTEA